MVKHQGSQSIECEFLNGFPVPEIKKGQTHSREQAEEAFDWSIFINKFLNLNLSTSVGRL